MNSRIVVDKTTIFKVDDMNFVVRELPLDIQREIEVMDYMAQRVRDIELELEINSIAYKAKMHHIVHMIRSALQAEEAPNNEGTSNGN